ncbi:hypothetical protein ANCCAN_13729 [Ancylostoma caninum]|uniref:Uncharacterized protein n=1 Tax=Ancylostoma caninum TaxID=29170 RepID=A0A368G7D8_ANCCA|nr:hypothetical protein ANCCAN_13729 [Ancylostoma caninum]
MADMNDVFDSSDEEPCPGENMDTGVEATYRKELAELRKKMAEQEAELKPLRAKAAQEVEGTMEIEHAREHAPGRSSLPSKAWYKRACDIEGVPAADVPSVDPRRSDEEDRWVYHFIE